MLYDSIDMKNPGQANPQRQNVDKWSPEALGERGEWRVIVNAYWVSFKGDESVFGIIW